jgi:hypothetical protein
MRRYKIFEIESLKLDKESAKYWSTYYGLANGENFKKHLINAFWEANKATRKKLIDTFPKCFEGCMQDLFGVT